MRFVLPVGCCVLGMSLIVACTGGPGSLDQSGDNGDQYGGIGNDTSATNDVDTGDSKSGNTTTSSSGGGAGTSSTTGGPPATPPKDLRASDYDQKCDADTDCQAVYEGPSCTFCQCANAAIAKKDITTYTSDQSSRLTSCFAASSSSSSGVTCAPCASPVAKCNGKKCGT